MTDYSPYYVQGYEAYEQTQEQVSPYFGDADGNKSTYWNQGFVDAFNRFEGSLGNLMPGGSDTAGQGGGFGNTDPVYNDDGTVSSTPRASIAPSNLGSVANGNVAPLPLIGILNVAGELNVGGKAYVNQKLIVDDQLETRLAILAHDTVTGTALVPTGLTGSVAASRYIGATASGAPTAGTHAVGDWGVQQDGHIFICTAPGSPGTFTTVGVGFSNPMSAPGDMIYGGSGGAATRLATGTGLLQSNGTTPAWTQGPTVTGEVSAADFRPTGLTGATAATRYVGGTTSGAPVSGAFAKGDWAVAQNAAIWICTAAGSPGTWTQISGGGGGAGLTYGTLGARPAAGTLADASVYVATDASGGTPYQVQGGGWAQIAAPVSASPSSGTILSGTLDSTQLAGSTTTMLWAWTTLSWPAPVYDNTGMYASGSPTRLTVLNGGEYQAVVDLHWPSSSTGARHVQLLKNGTTVADSLNVAPANADEIGQSLTWRGKCVAGDYFQVQGNFIGGGTATLNAVSSFTLSRVDAVVGPTSASVNKVQLDYQASTVAMNNTAIAANTWTNCYPAQTFTIDDIKSEVELIVGGSVIMNNSFDQACRVLIDGSLVVPISGSWAPGGSFTNVLGGAAPKLIGGLLTAGAHTAQFQIWGANSGQAYADASAQRPFRMTVLERKLLSVGLAGTLDQARVSRVAAYSMVNAADTALPFDTADYDTNGLTNIAGAPTRLTIATPGKYRVVASISISGNPGTAAVYAYFRWNGATVTAIDRHLGSNSTFATSFELEDTRQCVAGDYVELVYRQNSGSACALEVPWVHVDIQRTDGYAINPMTAQDDMIVAGVGGQPTRKAKGADNTVVGVDPTTHHIGDLPLAGQAVAPGFSKGSETVVTTPNADGSITITYATSGLTQQITFNPDGSITETFSGPIAQTKVTTFGSNGVITETIT